jgi:2-C-methyl-D-erythritol 4-phosphate cytidylyltransferase
MGGASKIWLQFEERSVLEWTLMRFKNAGVTSGVVVAQAEDHEKIAALLQSMGLKGFEVTTGGTERYLSVQAGLKALNRVDSHDTVLIHDAARCLVSSGLIQAVAEAAHTFGAALPVLEVVDTVKTVSPEGFVEGTVPRQSLRLAQTPQGFRKSLIDEAYRQWPENRVPTDDAEVAEHAGMPVRTVVGERHNLKLTRPEDIPWFEAALKGWNA